MKQNVLESLRCTCVQHANEHQATHPNWSDPMIQPHHTVQCSMIQNFSAKHKAASKSKASQPEQTKTWYEFQPNQGVPDHTPKPDLNL